MKKIFGTKQDRDIRLLKPIVDKINELESKYKSMPDHTLQDQTQVLKTRLKKGETLSDIIADAFAVVREASSRVLKMRHFNVQLYGGLVLHNGKIAEMKTGEGKTLTATLALYLNALTEKGVHIVTVNDYLAARDSHEMGQLYEWLGLKVGCILSQMPDEERKIACGRYHIWNQ